MFPLIESAGRRYASLHWVLRASSPASTVLSSATTSYRPSRRTSFPSLGGTSVALVVMLLNGRVRRRGLELVTRFLHPGIAEETTGSPKVPGEPLSVCTCSNPTPAGLLAPDHCGATAWPLVLRKQGLPRKDFRRSIAWLSDSLRAPCLMHGRLRRARYLTRRKTRFQLLVKLYWTGFSPARFR